MCIFRPKIPKTDPLPPPPTVKPAPEPPKETPEPRDLDVDIKPEVEFGSKKPSDALLAGKKVSGQSTIQLNRSMLNSGGASQQGLGGTTS